MSSKSLLTDWLGKVTGRRARDAPGAGVLVQPVKVLSGVNLEGIVARYGRYQTRAFDYATVRDFCDSADWLSPLMFFNGDLKDVQRPWALKAVLGTTPPGSRLIEIGGGEPRVAAALAELGYEVTLVDPYDGTGSGPTAYESYVKCYPDVRIVRNHFSAQLPLEPASVAAIFSISVLEHLPAIEVARVFEGIRRFLRPGGYSLHCIDSVIAGNDTEHHYNQLKLILGEQSRLAAPDGIPDEGLYDRLLAQLGEDLETFYLSAQGHHLWRGGCSYDTFPFRRVVSIQTCVQRNQSL
jgi:SAM-dependent methyltransferase